MLFTSAFTVFLAVAVAAPTDPVAIRMVDETMPAQLDARTDAASNVQADFDCKNPQAYNDCIANGCPIGIPINLCFPAINCRISFC